MNTALDVAIRPYQPGEIACISWMHMVLYQRIYHFKPVFE